MEVEILSKECIVPSSPTPPHLKTYNLSLYDQYAPYIYSPAIFFYPNNNKDCTNLSQRSELLKNSLSETLSRFYPLAGRIKDNLSIDCNDKGVCYVEAKTNVSLTQYLKHVDIASMSKLMLCGNPLNVATSTSYLVKIQETAFLCGGFAIFLLVCHLFCDGISMVSFIKDWAATSSSNSSKQIQILHPFLNASSVFPQHTPVPVEANPFTLIGSFLKKGKYVVKRFVFSSSAIASLKNKATSSSSLMNASRVEVVTAILSKSLMAAFKNKKGIDKPLGILHNVNLRQRAVPPLPDCSLGNYIQFAGAVFEENDELSSLVSKLREAIQKIDSDFVKNIQNEDGFFKFYEKTKELEDLFARPRSPGGLMEELVVFSSWCNFGLYDIDFGWGKPIWATWCLSLDYSEMDETTQLNLNTIMLMDSRTENGVEVWVHLDEENIVFLEKDKELLQYAVVNPSPLE